MNNKRAFSIIEILVSIGILAILSIGIYNFSSQSQKTVSKSANLLNFINNFARFLSYYERDCMKAILPSNLNTKLADFRNIYDPFNIKIKENGTLKKIEYIYDKKYGKLIRKSPDGKKIVLFDADLSDIKIDPFIFYFIKPPSNPGYRPAIHIVATFKERNNNIKKLSRITFFKYNKDVQDTFNSWKYVKP